ncbi:MAG: hypothetical protein HS115_11795 [Spirochaetales bacterium]|nr:hypothetical protein [Spirochaetales bacterium]
MIDLETETTSSGIKGDFKLDAADDLAVVSDDLRIVLAEIREHMEMRPADDVDYPELYSRQRRMQGSDDDADALARIMDAERILSQHPAIQPDSVSVQYSDAGGLEMSFRTKSGQTVRNFLLK